MLQVLLIDDNPVQLQVRKAVLTEDSISVCTASTAEEALSLLRPPRSIYFDVIVTDHMLPGENGTAFVRKLRDIEPRIPVLAVSGMAEAGEEYERLNVRFLCKPVPPEELIRCIRELGQQQAISTTDEV